MEALPADDPLTDFWPSGADPLYASKHNPFPPFTDIRDNPGAGRQHQARDHRRAGTPK